MARHMFGGIDDDNSSDSNSDSKTEMDFAPVITINGNGNGKLAPDQGRRILEEIEEDNLALLNGVGFFNCKKYANGQPCQTNYNRLQIQVPPKHRSFEVLTTAMLIIFGFGLLNELWIRLDWGGVKLSKSNTNEKEQKISSVCAIL
ncbi:hypothetical protein PCANC_10859 [Puccinia coronata f. sp. avenae]|uniref:Uncharacterized protein n=1 Tax=Puccinia coronata f. sp. avenae TaxID=200324 RepID=A0A2N5SWQ8_9BASI|nr:hypothetical protein PCANC_10859 [Puccinia coronata f. sp. avenae]